MDYTSNNHRLGSAGEGYAWFVSLRLTELIVKQWRCVLFPFWAFIFAGQ